MRRIAAILIIGTGVFMIFGALGFSFYSRALDRPADASLPDLLAGLSLGRHTSGWQAVGEINRLHGKRFPLTSGAVGVYGSTNQATLWVSGAPAGFIAGRILNNMRDRIADGRSPFTPAGQFLDGQRTVYQLDGMGQRHYYFRSKNLVIWLAVDDALAEQAIEQTLDYYP